MCEFCRGGYRTLIRNLRIWGRFPRKQFKSCRAGHDFAPIPGEEIRSRDKKACRVRHGIRAGSIEVPKYGGKVITDTPCFLVRTTHGPFIFAVVRDKRFKRRIVWRELWRWERDYA